jgi:hypothetical protein
VEVVCRGGLLGAGRRGRGAGGQTDGGQVTGSVQQQKESQATQERSARPHRPPHRYASIVSCSGDRGGTKGSCSGRPFTPPKVKVRAMPIAPIASRRSAS